MGEWIIKRKTEAKVIWCVPFGILTMHRPLWPIIKSSGTLGSL